jgi:hypothetical protein
LREGADRLGFVRFRLKRLNLVIPGLAGRALCRGYMFFYPQRLDARVKPAHDDLG